MDPTYKNKLVKQVFAQAITPPASKVGTKGTCLGTTKIDYCTEHASIKCSQASHFLKLQLPLPGGQRPKYGDVMKHRGAMVTDCIPEINYPVFTAPWNLCFSLLNPLVLSATTAKFAATGTWTIVPMPCCLSHAPVGIWKTSVGQQRYSYVPHPGKNIFTNLRNLSLYHNSDPKVDALTKNCTLSCLWMGTISIVSSGRDELNPAPYNPIDGLVGPSAFDCLRNACGMIMNYTGLGATVAIAALDSIAAGLQTGFEQGFKEGLKAGISQALGYGVGFAIGGLAVKGGAFGKKYGLKLGTAIAAKLSPQARSTITGIAQKLSFPFKKLAAPVKSLQSKHADQWKKTNEIWGKRLESLKPMKDLLSKDVRDFSFKKDIRIPAEFAFKMRFSKLSKGNTLPPPPISGPINPKKPVTPPPLPPQKPVTPPPLPPKKPTPTAPQASKPSSQDYYTTPNPFPAIPQKAPSAPPPKVPSIAEVTGKPSGKPGIPPPPKKNTPPPKQKGIEAYNPQKHGTRKDSQPKRINDPQGTRIATSKDYSGVSTPKPVTPPAPPPTKPSVPKPSTPESSPKPLAPQPAEPKPIPTFGESVSKANDLQLYNMGDKTVNMVTDHDTSDATDNAADYYTKLFDSKEKKDIHFEADGSYSDDGTLKMDEFSNK